MRQHQVFQELEVVSSVTATPLVSLNELKDHCRIERDVTDHDTILRIFVDTAEQLIENICEITLRDKTLKLFLSRFPVYCDYLIIRLEVPPITSITYFKYYDSDDVQQTLSSSLYENWLSHNPPSLVIKAESVPILSSERSKVVEIKFEAGDSDNIPAAAKLLAMELVAFWFQNREAVGRLPSDSGQHQLTQTLVDQLRWRIYP